MARILFIRGGAVGDFILTLPAMRLVREQLPEVELEVLGYNAISQLATASGIAADTRSIDYAPLAHFFVPGAELDAELKSYFAGFSVVVSYLYDPDGYFRENLLRAGTRHLVEASHRVDDSSEDARSAAHQLATPLEGLALYLEDPFVDLEFHEPAERDVDATLASHPRQVGQPLIALHPGSGSPRKNWSLEGWLEVAGELQQRFPGAEFLIVSGEAEAERIDDFLAHLDSAGIRHRLARDLPLPVLGAMLRRCDLFLGHDSGMSHLAAACGLPCVLLFGPTRAAVWGPQNPAVRIIEAEAGDLSAIVAEDVLLQAAEVLLP